MGSRVGVAGRGGYEGDRLGGWTIRDLRRCRTSDVTTNARRRALTRASRLALPAVVAALALSGCGDDGGDAEEGAAPEASTPDEGTETTAAPAEGGTETTAAPAEGATETTAAPEGGEEPAEGGTEVAIADFMFDPGELRVAAGSSVVWTNTDSASHSVKTDGAPIEESDRLNEGDTYEVTFGEAGEFSYICGFHTYMKGTVIVE